MKLFNQVNKDHDSEQQNIALMNQSAQLQAEIDRTRKEAYEAQKQLEQQVSLLREANKKLTAEKCVWMCLRCEHDFYGPSCGDKCALRCPMCSTAKEDVYCIPKELFQGDLLKAS